MKRMPSHVAENRQTQCGTPFPALRRPGAETNGCLQTRRLTTKHPVHPNVGLNAHKTTTGQIQSASPQLKIQTVPVFRKMQDGIRRQVLLKLGTVRNGHQVRQAFTARLPALQNADSSVRKTIHGTIRRVSLTPKRLTAPIFRKMRNGTLFRTLRKLGTVMSGFLPLLEATTQTQVPLIADSNAKQTTIGTALPAFPRHIMQAAQDFLQAQLGIQHQV